MPKINPTKKIPVCTSLPPKMINSIDALVAANPMSNRNRVLQVALLAGVRDLESNPNLLVELAAEFATL